MTIAHLPFKPLITLIGLPGSGKSTLGRQLARRLSALFLDSDQLIEQRLGCSIRAYFEREGEGAFRDLETRVLSELVDEHGQAAQLGRNSAGDKKPVVLSTGGGIVVREVNRSVLRSAGRVVYLRSSPEELYKRLKHDQTRPLLQGSDPLQKLRDLYEQRDPLYREAAHFQIDTGRNSVATLINTIAMQLELAST